MENYKENKETSDIEKIKKYLLKLGFYCNSHESARNLIYSKKNEVVIIKNNKN